MFKFLVNTFLGTNTFKLDYIYLVFLFNICLTYLLTSVIFSELKAEASLMDQMSSCDSSSDSKSSSSSSSEDSSSDSEDGEYRSSPSDPENCISGHPTMSAVVHCRIPSIDAGHNRYHDNSGLLMNTLSKYI